MTVARIESADQLNQGHYDTLAKAVEFGQQGDWENWEDQAFDDMGEAYGSADKIAATRETFDDYKASSRDWQRICSPQEFEIDGFSCIRWESIQISKGSPSVELTIVDFGGVRLSYSV